MINLIIDTPHLQNSNQQYGFAAITLFFWGLWFYLWLPFISLVAWFFGIKIFHIHMIELGGYKGFFELLGWYALIVLLIAIVYGAWILVHLYRFRDKCKRKPVPHVTDQQVAHHFRIDIEYLLQFKESRSIVVQLTSDGDISSIKNKQFILPINHAH